MRRLSYLLALFCVTVAHAVAAPLTVVTWNTKWFPGGKPNASEAAQAEQMLRAQPLVHAGHRDLFTTHEPPRECSVVIK